MDILNVFGGYGYIGSEYVRKYPNCIINGRDNYTPLSNNILYFISTIHNYNVLDNPFVDVDTNVTTLMKVLHNIKDKKNTTINFISSWFVYGDTEMPARETSYCNPKGFYSITKRTAEQLLISYCLTHGIQYRILRLANVIGGTDPKVSAKKNALTYLARQIKNNDPVKLYHGGNLYRDYIHLEDCVDAINLVITGGELNTIYNIGNGEPIIFRNMIDTMIELTGSKSIITSVEPPEFHKIIQVESMYMDNTKLKSLGYTQKFTTTDMIKDILK